MTQRYMTIKVPDGIQCPNCDVFESHPTKDLVIIRAFKYTDSNGRCWSQCGRCSGYYDKDLNPTPDNHDPEKGWFTYD